MDQQDPFVLYLLQRAGESWGKIKCSLLTVLCKYKLLLTLLFGVYWKKYIFQLSSYISSTRNCVPLEKGLCTAAEIRAASWLSLQWPNIICHDLSDFCRNSDYRIKQDCASFKGFSGGSVVKNSLANARDTTSIPGLGRSPEEGNGNPLQYSCLGNPMNRGAWWATVHGVTKDSDTTEQLYNNMLLLLLSHFGHVWLFTTPWTAAYQAPPSMGFSRQEYWSRLPLPSPIQQYNASFKQFRGSTLPFHSEWFTIVYLGQKLRSGYAVSGVSTCPFLHSGLYSTVREPQWRFCQLQSLLCTQEPWK